MISPSTLLRFRAGDPVAFAEVMEAYLPLVREVVRPLWKTGFEREEALQEAWVHIFKAREALDAQRLGEFPGWLAVVARRRCFELLRRQADPSAPSRPAELLLLDGVPHPAAAQPPPVERAELLAAVAAFREGVKPGWRRFFDLHFVEGLPYKEVAAELAISTLRCKYMKKVLAARARRDPALIAALGRGVAHAR